MCGSSAGRAQGACRQSSRNNYLETASADCIRRPRDPRSLTRGWGRMAFLTRCCFEFSRALFAHTPDLLVHYCTPLTQTRTSPPGPVHRRYSSSPSSIQACTQRKASPSAICSPPPPPDQRQTTGTSHTSCLAATATRITHAERVEHRRGKPWMEVHPYRISRLDRRAPARGSA
jgi:hypothetical protein